MTPKKSQLEKEENYFKIRLYEILHEDIKGVITWVKVQAIVSYDNRDFAKKFGFCWDNKEKIWAVFMPIEEYNKLKRSKSPDKKFDIKPLAYKFQDRTTMTVQEILDSE